LSANDGDMMGILMGVQLVFLSAWLIQQWIQSSFGNFFGAKSHFEKKT
jgi:hypothetical protein